MPIRKIAVVVTARPSYSRIKTAIAAIHQHPSLELQLVVAASALSERYGSAVRYIEADGFPIAAKVFNVLEGENLTAQRIGGATRSRTVSKFPQKIDSDTEKSEITEKRKRDRSDV